MQEGGYPVKGVMVYVIWYVLCSVWGQFDCGRGADWGRCDWHYVVSEGWGVASQ